METKYDIEITINNVTNKGIMEITNNSFVLKVNDKVKEIMYSSITKLLLNENDYIIIQLNDNNVINLKVDNYLECFNLLKQHKSSIYNSVNNNDNNVLSNLNTNKVIIHGHTEKELVKDLPILIYENDKLLVELERLNTFEYEAKTDTTLTFKYGRYKPSYYEVKNNQNVDLYLSLDTTWGKININTNANDITNNKASSKRKTICFIIVVCVGVYLFFLGDWIFGPVTEDKVCTRIQSRIKENMKDPSSMDFRSCEVYKKNNNEWYISGSVAGKNGFGGTSVQTFEAKAIIDGNDFKLDYVNVNAP